MGLIWLAILAIVVLGPSAFLCFYIYRKDRAEKEPIGLLVSLFIAGVCTCFPAGYLNSWREAFLGNIFVNMNIFEYALYLLLNYILGVGVVEEGLKWLATYFRTRNNPNFNSLFDGVIYPVFVSLGFATYENIHYFLMYGWDTAIRRAFTAVPGHMLLAVVMGMFYSEWHAKRTAQRMESDLRSFGLITNPGTKFPERKYLVLSFVVPAIVHGIYDIFCDMIGQGFVTAYLLFYVFLIGLYIFGFKRVKKTSKQDTTNGRLAIRMVNEAYPGMINIIDSGLATVNVNGKTLLISEGTPDPASLPAGFGSQNAETASSVSPPSPEKLSVAFDNGTPITPPSRTSTKKFTVTFDDDSPEILPPVQSETPDTKKTDQNPNPEDDSADLLKTYLRQQEENVALSSFSKSAAPEQIRKSAGPNPSIHTPVSSFSGTTGGVPERTQGRGRLTSDLPANGASQIDYTGLKLGSRYLLKEKMCETSEGSVYSGFDEQSRNYVSIKTISISSIDADTLSKHITERSSSVTSLNHPNILKIYNTCFDGVSNYCVGEEFDGCTLKDYLSQNGWCVLPQAKKITLAILSALRYANEFQLKHIRLNPENILYQVGSNIKISGFETGDIIALGSPYTAPELKAGGYPSVQSEIYSVGVIMYEMLLGKPPKGYSRSDFQPLISKHPGMQNTINALIEIIRKATAENEGLRYHSINAMISDLNSIAL